MGRKTECYSYKDDNGDERILTIIPWEQLADYPCEQPSGYHPIGRDLAALVGDVPVYWDETIAVKLDERLQSVRDVLVRRLGKNLDSLKRGA